MHAPGLQPDPPAQCAAKLAAPTSARPAIATGPAGGYSPGQLAKAYGVFAGASTSQTVAIVAAFNDGTLLADLNHFDGQYGLPHETGTSFKVVNQTGGFNSVPNTPATFNTVIGVGGTRCTSRSP